MGEKTKRFVGEVVQLTRDCDLGAQGERAVVTKLEAPFYMTLCFFDRAPAARTERTGSDYRYLKGC